MTKFRNDDHAIGGDIAMYIMMLAMMAVTIAVVAAMMGYIRDISISLLNGDMDEAVIDSPLVKQSYNWVTGTVMGSLGLAVAMIGVMYYIGALLPEAAAKAKGSAIKLVLAICVAPVAYIPFNLVIKLNIAVSRGFLSMASGAMGGQSLAQLWDRYYAIGLWSSYNLVPMFALVILGVAIGLFGVLIFRLIFMMISYALSPMSLVLSALPQTQETGQKLLKLFFEATFGLFFLDVGLMFTFACYELITPRYGGQNPALMFLLASAGLSFPVVFYRYMFTPLGKAVSSGLSAGFGAMSGAMAGGTGAVSSMGGGGGASKGGGGGGASSTLGKLGQAGGKLMQSSGAGIGGVVGGALVGGALGFAAGRMGTQKAGAGLANRANFNAQMKDKAAGQGILPSPSKGVRAKMEKAGFITPKEVKEYKKTMPGEFAKDSASVRGSVLASRNEEKNKELWANASSPAVKEMAYANSKEGEEKLNALHDKADRGGLTGEETAKLTAYNNQAHDYKINGGAQKDNEFVKDTEKKQAEFGRFQTDEKDAFYATSPEGQAELNTAKERVRTGGLGDKANNDAIASKAFLSSDEAKRKGISEDEHKRSGEIDKQSKPIEDFLGTKESKQKGLPDKDLKSLIGAERVLSVNPDDKTAQATKTRLTNQQAAWDNTNNLPKQQELAKLKREKAGFQERQTNWEKEHIDPHKQRVADAEIARKKYESDPEQRAKDQEKIKSLENSTKKYDEILPVYGELSQSVTPEKQKEVDAAKERMRTEGLGTDGIKDRNDLTSKKEAYRTSGEGRSDQKEAREIERLRERAKDNPQLIDEANGITRKEEENNKITAKRIEKLNKKADKIVAKQPEDWTDAVSDEGTEPVITTESQQATSTDQSGGNEQQPEVVFELDDDRTANDSNSNVEWDTSMFAPPTAGGTTDSANDIEWNLT